MNNSICAKKIHKTNKLRIHYYALLHKKFIVIIFLMYSLWALNSCKNEMRGSVHFKDGAVVFLEVAANKSAQDKGLMNRRSLPADRGMVFVFRPARKVIFWMKDTLIPLDIIFINNGKIIKIVENTTPNETRILYPSETPITEAIEVNAGFAQQHNLKTGDKVKFYNIPAIDYSEKTILLN